MAYSLYTDGGARGNPGPAGIGAVLYDESGAVLEELHAYIGEATNNQAEYRALILGMKAFSEKLGSVDLDCYLDSELVVKQLNGEYKVKNEGLKPLYREVLEVKEGLGLVTFNHVRREKNKEADRLVNVAIDQALNEMV